MKARILPLLLLFTCLGWGNALRADYRELHTTWDSLPMLQLPALESRLYTGIIVIISKVPEGAYGHVDSYGKCAQLCQWVCDVSEAGTMRMEIENAYGYGDRFSDCPSPIRVEFGFVRAGKQQVHCSLFFGAPGNRMLPKVRIGEVATRMEVIDQGTDSLIFIHPQIELLYPDPDHPLWLKPQWEVTIEGAGFEAFSASGWNDCSGQTTGPNRRSPCKPYPISASQLRVSEGVVKITFQEGVAAFVGEVLVELEFETEQLSFWYDLVHNKRVEH